MDRKFSEASDVWGYAITCVEVWTDAVLPYKGWMNAFVMEEVLNGYKLSRPDKCPAAFYERIISPCLEFNRSDRPLFADIEPVAEELNSDPAVALDVGWSAAGSTANPFNPGGRRISIETGAIVEPTSKAPLIPAKPRRYSSMDELLGPPSADPSDNEWWQTTSFGTADNTVVLNDYATDTSTPPARPVKPRRYSLKRPPPTPTIPEDGEAPPLPRKSTSPVSHPQSPSESFGFGTADAATEVCCSQAIELCHG